jgi:hypothetical protein
MIGDRSFVDRSMLADRAFVETGGSLISAMRTNGRREGVLRTAEARWAPLMAALRPATHHHP